MNTRGSLAVLIAVSFAAIGAAGCLDDQLDPNQTGSTDTFLPQEHDFQGFLGWRRVQVGDALIVDGHAAGPRYCYINTTPVGGSYPVGAIIVKTVETGDKTEWQIHARAKRGGGVNVKGALDWEWFELRFLTAGPVILLWGNYEPPVDHGYESLPGLGATATNEASCNGCHHGTDAESILAAPLRAELTP